LIHQIKKASNRWLFYTLFLKERKKLGKIKRYCFAISFLTITADATIKAMISASSMKSSELK
jgi:hypothetical protein